jgi:hypothetical protein
MDNNRVNLYCHYSDFLPILAQSFKIYPSFIYYGEVMSTNNKNNLNFSMSLKTARYFAVRLLALMSYLFITACSSHAVKQQELKIAHQYFSQDYESNLIKFNSEINQSLILRKRSVAFFTQERLEGQAQYFNSADISRIQSTVKEYDRNRQVLLNEIAYRYLQLIKNVELVFSLEKPSELVLDNQVLGVGVGNQVIINPMDSQGKEYLKVIKLGLAATLTLYDNFIIAIMPYQENGHFRRKINYDNIDNEKIIEKISGNFRRLDHYKDTLRVVDFVDAARTWEQQNPQQAILLGKDNDYFNVLISGSYTNQRIKEITMMDRLAFRTVRFRRILRDILFDVGNESMNLVSKVFGNTMGLVSSREGYLKNIPLSHKQRLEAEMKPGDILLEKTPFRLTDRFIPGHWGHVAIWVGSEQQLKELGVWELLPELYQKAQQRYGYDGPSFQEKVRSGHKIVEALRSGVQINTLEHFLNIDDMAVLRDKNVDKAALKRYVIRAFEQIGKEYDFNFDVETDKKIVCSELAFVAYDDYQWPVAKTAGRYTISPDHVGEKANGEGPFSPVLLYHDGKLIENNIQLNFNRLMKEEYDQVRMDLLPIH